MTRSSERQNWPLKKKYDAQTSVPVNTDDSQTSLFKQILSSTWEKSQAPSEEDNILEEKAWVALL